jgi:ubiquinone/menaquinone biosynthesis C-methylase UbiE
MVETTENNHAILSRARKALEIIRSAPSLSEGFKKVAQKALDRIPAIPASTKAMREAKTAYWQEESNFKSFVANTDSAKVPGAAYMDAVVNDFFLSHCHADSQVLDVGCGHGIVSIFLARHGLSVTACDISQPMLQELERNRGDLNIRIERANAYDLPFDDKQFDVVVSRMFLFQFPDWPKILREMARCCRRHGRLLIHFTSKENIDFAEAYCPRDCDFGPIGVTRTSLVRRTQPAMLNGSFDRAAINKACRKIGLRLIERAPCNFLHYNRLIGCSLGTERFRDYRKQLDEYLKDPKVLEFLVWFEKTVLRDMPVWISQYNILVLEKL